MSRPQCVNVQIHGVSVERICVEHDAYYTNLCLCFQAHQTCKSLMELSGGIFKRTTQWIELSTFNAGKGTTTMKGQSEIAYLPKFTNIMLIVIVIVITGILYIILMFDRFENQ